MNNLLVDQKNKLIRLINHYELQQATLLLAFIEPLWRAMDYGYKVDELFRRIESQQRYLESQD